ncbi:Uncharacterized protein TCM_027854 [Theobroma cacao]|uniref:Uncharacterized protein n=1 Tax=Theobroma cacao TaxID=3641 RepID=A0A061G911_THECC|nr:Uncharacterized protein TCM_027854 [Theobroma cacao]
MREWKKPLGWCYEKSKVCKDGWFGTLGGMEDPRWVSGKKKIYSLYRECYGDDEQRESWLGEPCRRTANREMQRLPNSKQRLLLGIDRKACLHFSFLIFFR